jgi:hypothetical protein
MENQANLPSTSQDNNRLGPVMGKGGGPGKEEQHLPSQGELC